MMRSSTYVVSHVEGRGDCQNVRVLALPQVWDGEFGADEGASRVDLLNQIEALDLHVFNTGWVNGTGIVDKNIDSTKCLNGLVNGSFYAISVPNIALDG